MLAGEDELLVGLPNGATLGIRCAGGRLVVFKCSDAALADVDDILLKVPASPVPFRDSLVVRPVLYIFHSFEGESFSFSRARALSVFFLFLFSFRPVLKCMKVTNHRMQKENSSLDIFLAHFEAETATWIRARTLK